MVPQHRLRRCGLRSARMFCWAPVALCMQQLSAYHTMAGNRHGVSSDSGQLPLPVQKLQNALIAYSPLDVCKSSAVLLLDLLQRGDGGGFSDRILLPLYQAMAFEQVRKASHLKVEPARNLAYEDANESFVLPKNVATIL
jgi:hypothetical protein